MGNERNDWSARKFILNPVVYTPCPHSKSFPPADQRSRFSLMPNSDHVGRSVLGSSRTLSSPPGRGVYIRNDSVVLRWHPFSHFYSEFLPLRLFFFHFLSSLISTFRSQAPRLTLNVFCDNPGGQPVESVRVRSPAAPPPRSLGRLGGSFTLTAFANCAPWKPP